MDQRIEFETPENVSVSYQAAGLGSRFTAWVVDFLILFLILFVFFIILIVVVAVDVNLSREVDKLLGGKGNNPGEVPMALIGVWMAIWGLSTFLYFGLSEFITSGQTLGKRMLKLRVVKTNGFALDASSILMRNLFRVIDNVPVLWIVPMVSKKSQRLGDMVAGTILVSDEQAKLGGLRDRLLARDIAEAQFRFDPGMLKKLRPQDVEAMERILERWHQLDPVSRDATIKPLLDKISDPLARRMNLEPPDELSRLRFLEDLLAAEYRRQYRNLG